MSSKDTGTFSLGLRSLQLLVDSLFDGCGGADALQLLDQLGDLNQKEQRSTLALFSKVLSRLVEHGERLSDKDESGLQDFEEALYKELLSSMREAEQIDSDTASNIENSDISGSRRPIRRLKLVGAKTDVPAEILPLDLDAARRRRVARIN